MQLNQKLTPTIFSRFIEGSISQSLGSSTIDSIQTCGEQTMRLINSITFQLISSKVEEIIATQE